MIVNIFLFCQVCESVHLQLPAPMKFTTQQFLERNPTPPSHCCRELAWTIPGLSPPPPKSVEGSGVTLSHTYISSPAGVTMHLKFMPGYFTLILISSKTQMKKVQCLEISADTALYMQSPDGPYLHIFKDLNRQNSQNKRVNTFLLPLYIIIFTSFCTLLAPTTSTKI